MSFEELTHIIKSRKSVFPKSYNEEQITDLEVLKILENATWAPTHKMTEPWSFIIFRGESKKKLGEELVRLYKELTSEEKISERKIEKTQKKILKSQAVIAIVLNTNPHLLPEWEEMASMAMAVQNMYLSCTALSIGSYWSSPKSIEHLGPFLNLENKQKCKGLFYMGRYPTSLAFPERERTPIDEKIKWRH